MSGGTPRKFAEKIAIMNRKQNEDVSTFDNIMREVRQITSTDGPTSAQPIGIPQQGGLHPPQWNQLGGSLPNVHQLPSYNQQQWPQWQEQQRVVSRSRSPEQHPVHYHPYGRGQKTPDRVPPLHPHYVHYPNPQHTLHPPDQWNQINRARSDPAIHHASPLSIPTQPMPMSLITGALHPQMPAHQMQPGPSGMTGGIAAGCPMPGCPLPQHPVNPSPLGHISMQNYGYPNNSPMGSPINSPLGSSIILEERNTPMNMMELSPPGMQHDPQSEAGSLPNIQQHITGQPGPSCYHQTVGQRHSTGACGPRLVPGPVLTPESQSAPTSPANILDPTQQPQWPGASRTFSNSPESLDIPRLVLTNPDGNHGQHLECFNDLQHLTLDASDMQMLCNGSNAQIDPMYEPQLLN